MVFKDYFKSLKDITSRIAHADDPWMGAGQFEDTFSRVQKALDRDCSFLRDRMDFLFEASSSVQNETRLCLDLIRRWTLTGDAPSMTALCELAINHFNIDDHHDRLMVYLASLLGEIDNDLPYHNNMHYRKVLIQLIRLITNHNDIYSGTEEELSAHQIALLLAAACIHDFAHDGKGNMRQGNHERAKLEIRSYAYFKDYLAITGLDDDERLQTLKIMLMVTDVSPLGSPSSPAKQMKAAYRSAFLAKDNPIEFLNLSEDLKPLEKDRNLLMICLLLHEADIATSAGLDYSLTKYETTLIMQEGGHNQAKPEHIIAFLETVCDRQMLSDAAQRLYAANMARIYALAKKDYKDGNHLYPPSEYAEFLSIHNRSSDQDGDPKSLH